MAALILAAAVFSGSAHADSKVYAETGDAYSQATDLQYPGVLPFKVTRVYNSRSRFRGILGPGWGFTFESRLRVATDGTVVIQESGTGTPNRFEPFARRSADAVGNDRIRVIDEMVDAYRRAGLATGTDSLRKYREKIKDDPDYREEQAQWLERRGLFHLPTIPKGTQLISERFGYEFLTKVEGGYMRHRSDNLWERYDDAGRLRRIWDDRQNYIDISYDSRGNPSDLIDGMNRKIHINYNGNGLASGLVGPYQQQIEYRYDAFGELVDARQVDGTDIIYKYDEDHRNLLLDVSYPFGKEEKFTYSDAKSGEKVKSFQDGEGWTTTYEYSSTPSSTIVTKTVHDQTGSLRAVEKTEDFWSTRPDGDKWLSRAVVTNGDTIQETTYNECCGKPVRIQTGNQQVLLEYDSHARLARRVAPDESEEWDYDPKTNQLVKHVVKPATGAPATETSYFYDAGGELLAISSTPGQKYGFDVDPLGRIRSLTDPKQRRFMIRYGETSLPVEISDTLGRHAHVMYADAMRPFGIQVENVEMMGMIADLTDNLESLRDLLPAGRFNYPELLEEMRDIKSALVMVKKASN